MGELLYTQMMSEMSLSVFQAVWIILLLEFIPAPSGNDLGAPEHYSGLARNFGSRNSSYSWDSSITNAPSPPWKTHHTRAPRSSDRAILEDAQASKKEKASIGCFRGQDEIDKTHQQRLTANSCMLAATINMTWEDKMKNSKWKNQRTCHSRCSMLKGITVWQRSWISGNNNRWWKTVVKLNTSLKFFWRFG